jgi:serine/threonine protein kinase
MICGECGFENAPTARFCARCGFTLEAAAVRMDDGAPVSASANTPVAPGTIFEGKYQVLEEIGRGGMGVVYRGHDLSLGRHVAIKVLPEQFNTDDDVITRFKKEARAMAALDHPNIVPVYAIGQQGRFHYFVMKYLEGQTVAELMEERRGQGISRLPPEDVIHIIMACCSGLHHAHNKGLVHRDVKPGNIMIGSDRQVTIMDFGIVKEEGGESLTRTGLVFGTPEYMAPEQAQGQAVKGPATDIYSLGVVAYEMLSGEPPFQGETPFSIVLKHIKNPPPLLVTRVDDVPEVLQDAVFVALEKKPENRYDTAAEFGETLRTLDLRAPAPSASRRSSSGLREEEEGTELSPSESLPDGLLNAGPPSLSATPPPVQPDIGEITSLPPPGQVPARRSSGSRESATPSSRPVIKSGGAPTPRATDAALLEDRPGHYRTLTTARQRRVASKDQRLLYLLGGATALAAIVGIVLILNVVMGSDDPPPPRPTPAESPSKPEEGAATGAASPGVEDAPAKPAPRGPEVPKSGLEGEVRVLIRSEPGNAGVYDASGGELGKTPFSLKRRRAEESVKLTLRKSGYAEKRINVPLNADATLRITLQPDH